MRAGTRLQQRRPLRTVQRVRAVQALQLGLQTGGQRVQAERQPAGREFRPAKGPRQYHTRAVQRRRRTGLDLPLRPEPRMLHLTTGRLRNTPPALCRQQHSHQLFELQRCQHCEEDQTQEVQTREDTPVQRQILSNAIQEGNRD